MQQLLYLFIGPCPQRLFDKWITKNPLAITTTLTDTILPLALKYKKLRDDYRKKHPEEFSRDSISTSANSKTQNASKKSGLAASPSAAQKRSLSMEF